MAESAGGKISDVRAVGLRVPDDLHAWLTETAEKEHRSLNGQVIRTLELARKAEAEKRRKPKGETG
jgi:predicted HicB family RNase H-like nuclease